MTREGRFWALASAAVLVVGLVRSINLLTLLGYLLLCTLLFNLWQAVGKTRGIRGHRRLSEPIVGGAPFLEEIELEGVSRAAVSSTQLVAEDARPQTLVDTDAREGKQVVRRERLLSRRGRQQIASVWAACGHPFGLVECRQEIDPAREVIVLPTVGRIRGDRLELLLRRTVASGDITQTRPQKSLEANTELHGLRPYQQGDSPRMIHWKTSARYGSLVVREYEGAPSRNLLLIFDPALAEDTPEARDLFEHAVSFAATVCEEWCHQSGIRFLLAIAGPMPSMTDGRTSMGYARELLELLAQVQPSPPMEAAQLVSWLEASPLPPVTTMLISTQESTLYDPLRRALRRPICSLTARDILALDGYLPPRIPSAQQ